MKGPILALVDSTMCDIKFIKRKGPFLVLVLWSHSAPGKRANAPCQKQYLPVLSVTVVFRFLAISSGVELTNRGAYKLKR